MKAMFLTFYSSPSNMRRGLSDKYLRCYCLFLWWHLLTFYWVTNVLDNVLNAKISEHRVTVVVLMVLMGLLLVAAQNCTDDLHNCMAPVYIWFLMSAKYQMLMLILLYLCILQSWKVVNILLQKTVSCLLLSHVNIVAACYFSIS